MVRESRPPRSSRKRPTYWLSWVIPRALNSNFDQSRGCRQVLEARLHTGGCRWHALLSTVFQDRFSGHIEHFREFEADDDEAALVIAEAWRENQPMELWNHHRKLSTGPTLRPTTNRLNRSKR